MNTHGDIVKAVLQAILSVIWDIFSRLPTYLTQTAALAVMRCPCRNRGKFLPSCEQAAGGQVNSRNQIIHMKPFQITCPLWNRKDVHYVNFRYDIITSDNFKLVYYVLGDDHDSC